MRGTAGFSVDNSVQILADDSRGIQRLIEYIARCPFSLARIVGTTPDGKVIYRAIGAKCFPFPKTGDKELAAGNPRNFEAVH